MCIPINKYIVYIKKGIILKVSRVTRHAFPILLLAGFWATPFPVVRPSACRLSAYVVNYTSNLLFRRHVNMTSRVYFTRADVGTSRHNSRCHDVVTSKLNSRII